ncbi:right-handed parallel beta-helix repeat-containing protein [Sphingomonas sp. SUN039]|uniref:right-handed parallel beta-helix repeat-containing protein n=1 Tax=Sphingomonas sp. SUN039 TaxID=2937787 RepID=UPI0021649028|nr:right-handed parallel beta-helix repeat-containing protein [Sphingomonas sp. SUN039]UVO52826.1 right-handed parallel beta-helix repeat-containing protein [Sphingomonas sp. SUN039]
MPVVLEYAFLSTGKGTEMAKNRKITKLFMAIAAIAATMGTAAYGQATRTWVSGVGDDLNPCSRTAPCKTFAGAISKTAASGEINCLDPGGFGSVTITKALTIACDTTEGGILAAGAGVSGIVVNAAATDAVFLSGLDIHGAGTASNGIRIIAGGSVHIQNSQIHGFRAASGVGISFQPSGATQLTVVKTTIANNGSGATGGGILIQPTGASGTGRIVLRNVDVQNNANIGIRVDTTGNTAAAGVNMSIDGSSSTGNGTGISVLTPAGTTAAVLMINGVLVANNSGTGIVVNGAAARARVGNSTITSNGVGVSQTGGGIVFTYGNNRNDANTTDGTFQAPVEPQE